jgi:hypothetical protein
MKRKKIEAGNGLNENSLTASVGQVDPSQRNQMIAYAAYFRAEKRGFSPDSELDDWLESEREVDRALRL